MKIELAKCTRISENYKLTIDGAKFGPIIESKQCLLSKYLSQLSVLSLLSGKGHC